MVDLAEQIKAAQGPEITTLQGWMSQWGMPMSGMPGMSGSSMPPMSGMPGMDHGGMSRMDGMMSPAQMDALTTAQGVEASKLFLTGMIAHHQGALTMAQDEINNGQFPDAIAMARSILGSQQKEIDTMNQILSLCRGWDVPDPDLSGARDDLRALRWCGDRGAGEAGCRHRGGGRGGAAG